MIKEFFNHPEPFHSHSGHVGMDSRGESIKLSIFKLATVLGDHVSNTDIHVQSSITDEEIDDIVKVPSDSAQKATEYVTSEFLKQMYYTKMDIDQMGFLKQIPDGFATEDYVNDRIRTQKEELEKYAASLIGDYVKPDDYNIFQNTVNSKLNTLTDKYVSLDQRVTGLSSDVSSLKSDVSSLKTRVSVLEKNGTGGSGTDKPGDNDNPGGDGTGGNSDFHKKTTVTYIPTVTQTTKGSYEIGTLYVDGEESTIWGKDNASTTISGGESVDSVKCATIQAYKAEKPNVVNVDKPGSFTTDNDTHLQITIFPVGWYSTLAQAVNAFGSNNASLWVSQITLYSDGTNSGWSTPQIYVNVQGLIQQATDDAQKYYKGQIEDANSEINKVIADAKSQLKILNDRINQGDEGHPDTSWREPVNKLVAEVNEYGWKVHEDLSVTYAERLFNAVEGEIVTRAGIADGTGGIKNAIQVITANFIKQQVYDYSANGKIDSSVLNLTPTQIVLKALEGIENPGDDVGKALNSAVIDIIKNRITLSIANDSGNGAQFVLKIDGNGVSQATLDTSKFVVTGDMIVNTVNTHGISIQSKEQTGTIVASIDSNGEARFGKGTTIFHPNGDAQLAGGNITWNSTGNLQVTGDITANSMSVACKDFKKDDISSAESNKMWFTNYASAKKISNGEIQNAQVELKDSDPVILFKREDNGVSRFFALSPLPLVKSGGDSFEQVVINCTDSISELPITFKNKHYFKSKTTGIYYDEPDIYTSSRPTTYKWNHSEKTNFVYDGFVYQNKNIYFGSSVDTVSFVQNYIRKYNVYIDYIESGQIKHQEVKQNVGIYNKSVCAVVKDNTSNVSNIVIEVNDELFNFRDTNGVISNTDIIDRVISFFNDDVYISDYDNYKSSGETNYHIITIDEFLQKNNDIYYSGISDMSEQFVKLNIGTYNRYSNLYKYNI